MPAEVRFSATIVDACVRDGGGGSPTAVVDDDPVATDVQRRMVAPAFGTSHAVFLAAGDDDSEAAGGRAVRFFTSAGELTGCGHGTVAAQAVYLDRSGADELRGCQRTGGRTFATEARRVPNGVEVWFDQGVVRLRPAEVDERDTILSALGLGERDLHPADEVTVASPGAPRLLIPVADRTVLNGVAPSFERLAKACLHFGHLGCFVYVPPTSEQPAAARMFAPAIGVPEDIANANSTGCLAAHLFASAGRSLIRVDQGDSRGCPSTVYAAAEGGLDGIRTRVGGVAVIRSRT